MIAVMDIYKMTMSDHSGILKEKNRIIKEKTKEIEKE